MNNQLGDNIRKLRLREKMTQTELAEKLGVSKQVVSAYEKGIRNPPYDVLIKITDVFCTSVDSLLKNALDLYELNIEGLTESQIESVIKLIAEFKKANKKWGDFYKIYYYYFIHTILFVEMVLL